MSTRTVLLMSVVVVAAACTSPPATGSSTTSGSPVSSTSTASTLRGRILIGIEENPSGPHSIAYLDATGLHPIAAPADDKMAQWSWGGRDAVLFTSERDGVRHVFWMQLGSDPVMIGATDSAQENPRMSPDGKHIVYEDYDPATNRDLGLHLSTIDGTHVRRITPAAPEGATWGYAEPSFSPDGRSIAFARVTDWDVGRAALYVMNLDGSGLHRLTSYGLDAGAPRWSPDGKTILFTQRAHAQGVDTSGFTYPLWSVPVAGGPPTQLTQRGTGSSFLGDWSPDGTRIVYLYHEPGWGYNQLRIMRADGSDQQVLWTSPTGSTAETPDWGS